MAKSMGLSSQRADPDEAAYICMRADAVDSFGSPATQLVYPTFVAVENPSVFASQYHWLLPALARPPAVIQHPGLQSTASWESREFSTAYRDVARYQAFGEVTLIDEAVGKEAVNSEEIWLAY